MPKPISISSQHQQQGVVLVVSLIILLVLTIIGLASIQISTVEEKMAGNNHDHEQAFLAAEAALRSGETYLATNSLNFTVSGANGLYDSSLDTSTPVDWKANDTHWKTIDTLGNTVASAPKYFIEKLPDMTVPNVSLSTDTAVETEPMFRITAQGYGKTTLSRSVVTSTYKP